MEKDAYKFCSKWPWTDFVKHCGQGRVFPVHTCLGVAMLILHLNSVKVSGQLMPHHLLYLQGGTSVSIQ